MIYEFVYVTIHYQCGHKAIRAMLIGLVGKRERWTFDRCAHCADQLARRYAIAHEVEREQMEAAAI